MKTMRRLSCAVLAIAMLLCCFAAAEGADGAIRVGTNAEFPPFEFINDEGEFDGFDMDLIRAILDWSGDSYTIETMDFGALVPALSSGKLDVVIAAMTIREDRLENALFSDPYLHATQKVIVQENSAIASEADLAGKRVGVQADTTGDIYLSELAEYECTVERYNKALDAVMDLAAGRLDAVVVDEGPSAHFIEAVAGLKMLDDVLSDEYYGIAMALGQEEAMAVINEALAALIADGTFDAIYAKHFGTVETGATDAAQ